MPVWVANHELEGRPKRKDLGSEVGTLTVALGQFLLRDRVVLGWVQLDRHLGGKALGFGFVFDHCGG